MVKRFLIVIVLAVLAAGCEYDFELKGYDDPDKLFVECVATGSDTTLLRIHTCLPTARSGDVKTVTTVLKTLSASSDGKELKINKLSGQDNLWIVTGSIPGGSVLKVSAEAEGSDPVEGQCRIPEKPSIGNVSVEIYPDEKKEMYEVDVDLNGDSLRDEEKWAVSCIYRIHMWTVGIPEEEGGEFDDEGETNIYVERHLSSDSTFSDFEQSFLDCGGYGPTLHICCDDNGSDGHLRFYVPRYEDFRREISQSGWEDWNGTVHPAYEYVLYRKSRLYIRVYKVAGEMYNYVKAQDASENNVLALAGLAPAMFAYSNVKGGFGLVAGYSGGKEFVFEGK